MSIYVQVALLSALFGGLVIVTCILGYVAVQEIRNWLRRRRDG